MALKDNLEQERRDGKLFISHDIHFKLSSSHVSRILVKYQVHQTISIGIPNNSFQVQLTFDSLSPHNFSP